MCTCTYGERIPRVCMYVCAHARVVCAYARRCALASALNAHAHARTVSQPCIAVQHILKAHMLINLASGEPPVCRKVRLDKLLPPSALR